jgi:hypothetical protein
VTPAFQVGKGRRQPGDTIVRADYYRKPIIASCSQIAVNVLVLEIVMVVGSRARYCDS